MDPDPRTKLTLSVDSETVRRAKEVARRRKTPLSRLVESYFQFLGNPELYCFQCGGKFEAHDSRVCPKCGWLVHKDCGACRCNLDEETASAVFYMRKVYEDLLGGRVE